MTAAGSGVAVGGSGPVPAYVPLFAVAIAAQAFSGSWDRYGSPIPLDRVLLAAAVVSFLCHPDARAVRLAPRPIHVLMVASLAWCLFSMIWFGTLRDPLAVFAFLDSFGAVPFLLFLLAPVVFSTPQRRDTLAAALTGLGLYVGYVSVAQGLRWHGLVVPSTIVVPEHGHFERALGPSLQVGSNGLALLGCLAYSAVYAARRSGLRRAVALCSMALCAMGVFFTLTRSMWLALLIGVTAVVLVDRRLRRAAVVGAAAGVTALGLISLAVPTVLDAATTRAETSRSVYDRFNANEAALRIVAERPLLGVGFQRFHDVEAEWVRQSPTYPITNMGIDVHNVVLGHAAEIGLPGTALWGAALGCGILAAVRGARSRDKRPYLLATVGYGLAWLTVSMLVPIKYALPTSLLWVSLGLLADPRQLGWTSERIRPSAQGRDEADSRDRNVQPSMGRARS